MIRQYLIKKAKIFKGVLNTYVFPKGENYNPAEWWDHAFYTRGISDRKTMSPQKDPLSARYHYNSVEMKITRHLFNHRIPVARSDVLDIGSGSGHWIDFYQSLHAREIVGLDVSRASVDHLKKKYAAQDNIRILHGKAVSLLDQLDMRFHIINAIGVMFHIVHDSEWRETIHITSQLLKKQGVLIVGSHFGLFNSLNVQISRKGEINKRLRSRRQWKRTLIQAGFSDVRIYPNRAYLHIRDTLPENNVLIATK